MHYYTMIPYDGVLCLHSVVVLSRHEAPGTS